MTTGKSLLHLMDENRTFPPLPEFQKIAHFKSLADYEKTYQHSIQNNDAFWLEMSDHLHWFRKPTVSCNWLWNTSTQEVRHSWFEDGLLNVSYNCLDRHLDTARKEKIAIIWQGEADGDVRKITYSQLHQEVCRLANVLKSQGVKKGDRVCIYLPMIPEAAVAMLACTRIGAIHTVVFGGFSAEALASRMVDCQTKLLITADGGVRGGKQIPLKAMADEALKKTPSVEKVIVVKHLQEECSMLPSRDLWYHELMAIANDDCPPEELQSEDPLFILYTSGSTGQPKGVVHTQGGYLLQAALTHKWIFDLQEESVYWCTADVGWVTGHSYGVYGPLANGATTVMFEGIPTYPDPGRFWQIIDKFSVSIFYTAPTAIRTLISLGDEWPEKYKLNSLRVLGSVGEPINPEAWIWYHEKIGHKRCPIVDTWWQTETGGIMISPLPGAITTKPGSAGRPFFGVHPVLFNSEGGSCPKDQGGALCIDRPWPGIMRTMWGDHDRFIKTYFSTYSNCYFSGDSCRIDAQGDYWLMGRMDDVVNVSGHRIGTAEVESSLVSHGKVAEAAVVPMPHDIKGQALCAFVILIEGTRDDDVLKKEILQHVKIVIGAIAVPDQLHFTSGLPKTRSGKIMRRILRKIAEGNMDLGDVTTLADSQIVQDLIKLIAKN